jgi:hypothetical protein
MKIQVNSDKTIGVDASLTSFVENEVGRVLDRFSQNLTRVEVHLSDIDNKKTGRPDKRCLVEARLAGDRPMSASATSTKTESAVSQALGKMQRSLTTFFGRRGRPAKEVSKVVPAKTSKVSKTTTNKHGTAAVKKISAKKTAAAKPKKLSPRGPKKT